MMKRTTAVCIIAAVALVYWGFGFLYGLSIGHYEGYHDYQNRLLRPIEEADRDPHGSPFP